MTLCPRRCPFRHLSTHPPPHLRLSGHLYLSIHLPQSPHLVLTLRTGLWTPPGCAPLPPSGVSLQSPGRSGLWRPVGAALPLPLGLQQSPSPQEACLENIPAQEGLRRGRPAPRAWGGHNDSPETYADTAGGPSTQTRARTHTVPHNRSPASGARTGTEPTLDPRQQARSRKQPQAPALGPSIPRHPDTQTRPQRLLGPARRSPRPFRPGGLTWPRSGPRLALLPLLLAPARPRGRCGGMGPAGGGSALPCHGDTRGRGGVRAQTVTLRPLSLCPAPRKPRPSRLRLLRRSSAPVGGAPPFLRRPRPLSSPAGWSLGSHAHHSALGTLSPNFASAGTLR